MLGSAGDSPFVGREQDLVRLETALRSRGSCPGVFVAGDAGIGKSRLVLEFIGRAARDGATVIDGACLQAGGEVLPFAPFVEALGELHELLGLDADALFARGREELAAIVPDLGPAPAVGAERIRLFDSVRSLLDRSPDPTILVIEDIHWVDRSSLELLSYLIRKLRHGRTFVVATTRRDAMAPGRPLSEMVAELQRAGRAGRIDLEPLGLSELERLVVGRCPDLRPDEVARIAARSVGNPFFLQELVAAVGRPDSALPATLRDLLLVQIHGLADQTRRVLDLLTVAGRAVTGSFLEAAWAGSTADLDAALAEGLERNVLAHDHDGSTIGFRHALYGDVVREGLGPRQSIELHGRLASLLTAHPELRERTEAGATAELADHWAAALCYPAALKATVDAAVAAARVPAWTEAYDHYRRALELWDRVPPAERPDGLDRADLLHAAARVAYAAVGAGPAVDLEREAIEALGANAAPTKNGSFHTALARWLVVAGDVGAMLPAAQRAVALVPADPPSADRAMALAALASALMNLSRNAQAAKSARAARAIAAATDSTDTECWAQSLLAACLVELGHDEEALIEADAAADLARTSSDVWSAMAALGNRVAVQRRVWCTEPERAATAFEAVLAAADRWDVRSTAATWIPSAESLFLFNAGRWDELDDRIASAQTGDLVLEEIAATMRVVRGQLDAGEAASRRTLASADVWLGPEEIAEIHLDLALAEILRGHPDEALAILEGAARNLEGTEAPMMAAWTASFTLRAAADLAEIGRARRDAGMVERAEVAGAAGLSTIESCLDGTLVEGMALGRRIRAACSWGLAEASRLKGRSDPTLWAAATADLDSSWRPDVASYSHYRTGEALLASGAGKPEAVAELTAARTRAARLRQSPLLADIESLARRGRIDLPALAAFDSTASIAGNDPAIATEEGRATRVAMSGIAVAPDRYGLTARESEVLALLLEGRTNREIGERLFVTEKTASVHVTHILDKLGVNSRGAAAALAVRAGLVDAARDEPHD